MMLMFDGSDLGWFVMTLFRQNHIFHIMVFCKNNSFSNRVKIILVLAIALLVAQIANTIFAAEKYPSPRGAVNDFANVINKDNAVKIEALSREVLQKTGTAVVVVTVPTIGEGEETSLYANGLYKAWGIGKKGEAKEVEFFPDTPRFIKSISIETGFFSFSDSRDSYHNNRRACFL